MSAIHIRGLGKAFDGRPVLRGIDLDVPDGGVLALLGPNGAGKTTTVRIVATLLEPDTGTVEVAGENVVRERAAVRRALALTGQDVAVDTVLTGHENLALVAALRGLRRRASRRRAAELLEHFDLADAADRRVGTWSGGMRRRLDLAAAVVVQPRVLVLDEPTTGLDPRSRQAVWSAVRELVLAGTSVLLTTQYLEEADRLADDVAVLDDGRVVARGTPAELKARIGDTRLELELRDADAFARARDAVAARVVGADEGSLTLALATDDSPASIRALLDLADPAGDRLVRFGVRTATLDDVFLAVTAHAKEPARV
ncbi:MAG TPA: ATP-binding cassette domain-containing protein [Kineosporiaceae bacterium]|nr:ATP-binding cassette domain-containing protein [Kineosporiaceae bacterium]